MHLLKLTLCHARFPTREHYPFYLDVFHKTSCVEFTSPVTFFVGENGTGKSTLLRALCQKCGIYIWDGAYKTRFEKNPYEGRLPEALEIEWMNGPVPGSFFSSQIFQDYVDLVDEWAVADPGFLGYFGGKSLATQSHGQSLMSYFTNRYQIRGLYFLDEPETALSPKTQIKLLQVISNMSSLGHAQFIIATHSPILMSCPGAAIFSFDFSPLKKMEFRQTDHYTIFKDFMKSIGE